MTEARMAQIYRIGTMGLMGFGTFLVLVNLPLYGLYLMILPGVPNLLNSYFGRRLALLRWGTALMNAGLTALWWLIFHFREATDPVDLLITGAVGVLTLLSISLASSWGKGAKAEKATE